MKAKEMMDDDDIYVLVPKMRITEVLEMKVAISNFHSLLCILFVFPFIYSSSQQTFFLSTYYVLSITLGSGDGGVKS